MLKENSGAADSGEMVLDMSGILIPAGSLTPWDREEAARDGPCFRATATAGVPIAQCRDVLCRLVTRFAHSPLYNADGQTEMRRRESEKIAHTPTYRPAYMR